MALDAGGISEELKAHPDWKDVVPSVTDAATLGDGLRIAREYSGRCLAELSSLTRVPPRYLTALEQNDFSTLPNRVFSIGYVRAYAGAPPVQRAFNPRGAIYGASASASQVVIQARKAASLVVRMADGRVLFARQLAAGDAWRAPAGVAAVVDVSSHFTDFDVYLNGEHGGTLTAEQTPLSQLNARAQTLARQAAAEVVARTQAAQAEAQAQAEAVAVETAPVPATGG